MSPVRQKFDQGVQKRNLKSLLKQNTVIYISIRHICLFFVPVPHISARKVHRRKVIFRIQTLEGFIKELQ